MRHFNTLHITLCLLLLAGTASAQQLRFQFTDPSFGGNPFYSTQLQGVASAQNGYFFAAGGKGLIFTENKTPALFSFIFPYPTPAKGTLM